MVDDGQRARDGVDEVDAHEQRGAVGGGHEGHEAAADHAGDAAEREPGEAVGGVADAEADDQGGGDGDDAAGHVEEGRALGGEAEALDEGGGVGCDDAAGDGDLGGGRVSWGLSRKCGWGRWTYADGADCHEPELDICEDF